MEGSMNKIWNHILIRPTANVTLNLTFCKVGNEQMKVVQRKYVQKVALNVYLKLHIIYSNRKVTGKLGHVVQVYVICKRDSIKSP